MNRFILIYVNRFTIITGSNIKEVTMKKRFALLSILALGLVSCTKGTEAQPTAAQTGTQGNNCPIAQTTVDTATGSTKEEDTTAQKPDAVAGATETGKGGLNFGTVSWTNDLMKSAVKEYVKGHKLTDGTDSYREMYQIATVNQGVPQIASVEYFMDPETFTFYGSSESATGKVADLMANPTCALYWTRQLRQSDMTFAANYFMSYGIEVEGSAVFYDAATVNAMAAAEKANIITAGRNYYKSMGAQYAAYYDSTNAGYLADDVFVSKVFGSPATKFYAIKPTKIVLTSPYLMFVNYIEDAAKDDGYYFAVKQGSYTMAEYSFLSKSFLKSLLDFNRTSMGDQTLTYLSYVNYQTGESKGLKTQTSLVF